MVIGPLLNSLPGGPEICVQGFLPLDLLPTKAVELNLPGLISASSLRLDANQSLRPPYDRLFAHSWSMISARACPHAGGPTHCSRALAIIHYTTEIVSVQN